MHAYGGRKLNEKESPILGTHQGCDFMDYGLGCTRSLSEKVSTIVSDTSKVVWRKHEPKQSKETHLQK